MVVLQRPPLLLLDEPTAGVDVHTRNRLLDAVNALAEAGTAVVYSTHYLHEVEHLEASRVGILARGKIAALDSIPNLLKEFGDASVELHFADRPPVLKLPEGTVAVGARGLRVPATSSPAATAAELLKNLEKVNEGLREVRLVQPSLESVFLALTGSGSEAQ